jgi:hypothetical protein
MKFLLNISQHPILKHLSIFVPCYNKQGYKCMQDNGQHYGFVYFIPCIEISKTVCSYGTGH